MLGLPFGFASHFSPTYLHEALRLYREQFRPSKYLDKPYALACVNVIAADTDEEAQWLATSFYQLALGMFRNTRRPLPPPVASMSGLWTEAEERGVLNMMTYSFIGSQQKVMSLLGEFIASTGVDEVMVASHVYDFEKKMRSYEALVR